MGSRDHSYECEQCGHLRGGLNDLRCDCDEHDLFGTWAVSEALATLAHNIGVAGGLCRAFSLGGRHADDLWAWDHVVGNPDAWLWRPGCRRPAP